MANILFYQKHIRLRTVKTYRTASIELTENEVSAQPKGYLKAKSSLHLKNKVQAA